MRRTIVPRGATYQPMSRQQRRALVWLLVGTFTVAAYYLLFARPIDRLAVPFYLHETYMNDCPIRDELKASQTYDWRHAPFVNTIESYIPLPNGIPHQLPPVQHTFTTETRSQRQRREARRVAVRDEFQRAWESYQTNAWGQDELRPITGEGLDDFGGWGATLVDSLDTLWMMGFKDEFYEAVEAVAAIDFGKSEMQSVSVFETTIRYLGGMLSAYDLSHEAVLLAKAVQVGEMLYRAFDTPNNTPLGFLDIEKTKEVDRKGFAAEYSLCFACIGSLTMEFTRLAQITSQPKYYDVVAKISLMMDHAQNGTKIPGLWPVNVNAQQEEFNQSGHFSIGALADSSYEYLPKMHALLGGLDPSYDRMYRKAAAMIDKHMLFRAQIPDPEVGETLLFPGDARTPRPGEVYLEPDLQHLSCFVGGMFGLAGRLFKDEHHVDLGAKLTKGCVYAYAAMPSGIMPETFTMKPCKSRIECSWNQTEWEEAVLWRCGQYVPGNGSVAAQCGTPPGFTDVFDKRYLLRPEAIESVFIMYRITGEESYLDGAWDMFTSIVAASRTPYANGQVIDVTIDSADMQGIGGPRVPGHTSSETTKGNIEDKMESFWTAETLKYFYLIFSPPDMISLDDFVFNTEAHPFRRPKALLLT